MNYIFVDHNGKKLDYGYASFSMPILDCIWCGKPDSKIIMLQDQHGFCCMKHLEKYLEKNKQEKVEGK